MDESVAIQEFLAANGGAFCDECMSGTLGTTQDDLKAAIFVESRVFARMLGRCRWCRRSLAVTALRRAA